MSTSKSDRTPTRILSAAETHTAGNLLRDGRLVVIPTETVYGLAAAAVDETAVAEIFRAKGRPQENPLIVHLAEPADLRAAIPRELVAARRVVDAFVPGPVTIVVPAPPWVVPAVTGGLDTVALRVPAHPVARAVIAAAGVPVAAPSANRSGRPSPTTAEMAYQEMNGRVAAVVDGGACEIGIESTVVDGTDSGVLRVLRPGRVTAAELRERCGVPVTDWDDPSGAAGGASAAAGARSPGTRFAHYQPDVPVRVFPAADRARVRERARRDPGIRVLAGPGRDGDVASWDEYARRLYRELWEAERTGATVVFLEEPAKPHAPGLYDRVHRAAGTPSTTD